MIATLDRQAWTSLSEQVATDLAPIFEADSGALGPEGGRMATQSLGKLSLASSRSVQDVANVVVLLDAAGQHQAVSASATVFRRVPFTGNQTIFEPIRQVFALTFRRLSLLGSPDARNWESLLSFAENGGEPGPIVLREATVRRLDGLLLKHYWQAGTIGGSRAAQIANICAEIRELATMWALGGSTAWPRSRIDEEMANNVAVLRELQAIH